MWNRSIYIVPRVCALDMSHRTTSSLVPQSVCVVNTSLFWGKLNGRFNRTLSLLKPAISKGTKVRLSISVSLCSWYRGSLNYHEGHKTTSPGYAHISQESLVKCVFQAGKCLIIQAYVGFENEISYKVDFFFLCGVHSLTCCKVCFYFAGKLHD